MGKLRYDIYVKKRGVSSNVTFGMIAGVHVVLKSGGKPARKEYWTLAEENSGSLYEFSAKGDSGSLVCTNKGDAVGIIIAGWHAIFDVPPVLAAVLPNEYWDMKGIPFPRDEQGKVNFTEYHNNGSEWTIDIDSIVGNGVERCWRGLEIVDHRLNVS